MKTAEGACVTPNGAPNAQAKGLATVFSMHVIEKRSLLERGPLQAGPPKEQTRIAG